MFLNFLEKEVKMETIFQIIIALVALKSMAIGSDFNFNHWIKDGKNYTEWYKNRPKYKLERR